MSAIPQIKAPEEMKSELEKKEESPEERVEKLDDPRLQEFYEFTLDYTNPRGRTWKGPFKNKILDFQMISQVGIIKANQFGGLPIAAFDAYTVDHNEKISHLTVSLVSRPDWCEGNKLSRLKDKGLLDAIYKEVSSHERTFHGHDLDQKDGGGGSGDGQG